VSRRSNELARKVGSADGFRQLDSNDKRSDIHDSELSEMASSLNEQIVKGRISSKPGDNSLIKQESGFSITG
jgi:hypothetical protein